MTKRDITKMTREEVKAAFEKWLAETEETEETEGQDKDFETALEKWLEGVQRLSDEFFSGRVWPKGPLHHPSGKRIAAPIFTVPTAGRKYLRVVRTDAGRSVYCFIEKATGNIWKAAGWKGPALNFPRGNIYDEHGGLLNCNAYSVG